MAFCTNCGSAMEGRFCPQCGTQAAAETPAPATSAPPAARKKRGPLFWLLLVFGCIAVLGVAAMVGTGLFVASKLRQAGVDSELMRTNPTLAMTRLLAAMNPDVEVISVDEKGGLITLRQKSTGKTVTMNFEDVKKGKIVFQDEHGEQVAIQAEGDAGSLSVTSKDGSFTSGRQWTPPDWIPVYAGASIDYGVNNQSTSEEGGAGTMHTPDPPADVASFYERALQGQGLQVSKAAYSPDGAASVTTLTAQDEATARRVQVVITEAEGTTRIQLSYSVKR